MVKKRSFVGVLTSQANSTQTFCGMKNKSFVQVSSLGNNPTSLYLGQLCFFLGQGVCSGREMLGGGGAVAFMEAVCR